MYIDRRDAIRRVDTRKTSKSRFNIVNITEKCNVTLYLVESIHFTKTNLDMKMYTLERSSDPATSRTIF